MNKQTIPFGGKRPQFNLDFNSLLLDTKNPRLPEKIQGSSQEVLLENLFEEFDLYELALSMAENGYFDEEPLVAVPTEIPKKLEGINPLKKRLWKEYLSYIEEYTKNPENKFIVVEGNRRLSTIKLFFDETLRQKFKVGEWPEISEEIKEDISALPVIIYPDRKGIIPYLGVRHIIGVKKWESYAKAKYIADMRDKQGLTLNEIKKKVGDGGTAIKKAYISWKIICVAEGSVKSDYIEKAKNKFSYLLLSLNQTNIKDYLGIKRNLKEVDEDNPLPKNKTKNLKLFFSFLFGEEGIKVIKESRDITGKLTIVLGNSLATKELVSSRDLEKAFDLAGGQENFLLQKLDRVRRDLTNILSLIDEYGKEETKMKVKKCRLLIELIEQKMEK